jgi:hypothetical protein
VVVLQHGMLLAHVLMTACGILPVPLCAYRPTVQTASRPITAVGAKRLELMAMADTRQYGRTTCLACG